LGGSSIGILGKVLEEVDKMPVIAFLVRAISRLPDPLSFLAQPHAPADEAKIRKIISDGAGWVRNLAAEMKVWVEKNPNRF